MARGSSSLPGRTGRSYAPDFGPAFRILKESPLGRELAAHAPRPRPQLDDAGGPDDPHHQPAAHGRQQQRDPQRQVAVDPEEADLDALGVLQDEDEQEEQDDRPSDDARPRPARARPLRGTLSRGAGRLGRARSLRLAGGAGCCSFGGAAARLGIWIRRLDACAIPEICGGNQEIIWVKYPKDYTDATRARIDADLAAYEKLGSPAKSAGPRPRGRDQGRRGSLPAPGRRLLHRAREPVHLERHTALSAATTRTQRLRLIAEGDSIA
jgi:hypothetical protein